jgi:hypothetical protein
VIDAAAVDGRRRLILIRRDNVEHLLMIGGPTDVVVEPNIVRAVGAARDVQPARPPAAPGDTLPRAVPLGEGNMWPLQPHPEPAPAPVAPPRHQRPPVVEEPVQWHEPEPAPPPMPPMPVRAARPEPRTVDPLAGLAAELSRQPLPEPAPRPQRAPREREQARMREPERMREPPAERTRPAPPPSAPAEEQFGSSADQNLAEMAQRLEAALRRPKASDKPAEARQPSTRPQPPAPPAPAVEPETAPVADASQPDEAPPAAPAPTTPAPAAARPESKPAQQKSVYDSLEQEMASLLGRPNSKT